MNSSPSMCVSLYNNLMIFQVILVTDMVDDEMDNTMKVDHMDDSLVGAL